MCFAKQLCVKGVWKHEDYEKWRLYSVYYLRSLSDTYTARSGSPPPFSFISPQLPMAPPILKWLKAWELWEMKVV